MPIYASNESRPRELTPSGNFAARCYMMIELGHVKEEFQGKSKIVPKVIIGWELPTITRDTDTGKVPWTILKEYTLYMNDKANLRKELASWRGKDFTEEQAAKFDITAVLGAPCMINIIHEPKKTNQSVLRDKISAITPLPQGLVCPPLKHPLVVLSFDKFDTSVFNALPDFIKDKIKSSTEYQEMMNPTAKVTQGPVEREDLNSGDNDMPF